MAKIRSKIDNSESTSPTASTITTYVSGDTPMEVLLSSGEQVTLVGINGGNPITTSPFNFTYNTAIFPSGINPVVSAVTPTLTQSVISFGSVTTTTIALTWTSVPNATNYVVRRALNSTMTGSVQIYSGSLLGFTDSGLTANTNYYYTVTASAVGYISSTSMAYVRDTSAAVGRVFVVGNGTGDIDIDGANPTWSPLQANDTFKINGGNYTFLNMKNLKPSGGGVINITNNSGIINVKVMTASGTSMNVNMDFYQKVSGQDYGVIHEDPNSLGEKFRIDEDGAGGFEIKIKGVVGKNFDDRGWRCMNPNMPYNNGAGKMMLKLFDVRYCKFTNDVIAEHRGGSLQMYGEYYPNAETPVDKGYIDKLILDNIILERGQYDITAQNVGDFEITNILEYDLNTNVSPENEQNGSYEVNHYHARNVDIGGNGFIRNVRAKNSFGCSTRIIPFSRGNAQKTSIVSNVISDGNLRYSATEVNTFESQQKNVPGISSASICKVIGVTAKDLGQANTYTSVAVDVFGDGADTFVYNTVSIGCYQGGIPLGSVNGPIAGGSNNVGYLNNSATKLNLTTYVPAADSVLKGAGILFAENPTDIYGSTRISPDTIGAVKAL